MFEWHGWVTVRASARVEDDPTEPDAVEEPAVSAVRSIVGEPRVNEVADVRQANGAWHVWLAGQHNHSSEKPVDLFRAIARAAPGSYGVLHTHEHGVDRDWIRWTMRRGLVSRGVEEALSPHLGAVEDNHAG